MGGKERYERERMSVREGWWVGDEVTLWSEKVRRGDEIDGGRGKGGEYMNGECEGYLWAELREASSENNH